MIGPAFEFSDFRRWLNQEAEFFKIPFPLFETLRIISYGFICAIVFKGLNMYFPAEYLYDPDFVNNSFVFKIFYIYISMETFRLKYLVAFFFADAGVVATGLGYIPN